MDDIVSLHETSSSKGEKGLTLQRSPRRYALLKEPHLPGINTNHLRVSHRSMSLDGQSVNGDASLLQYYIALCPTDVC